MREQDSAHDEANSGSPIGDGGAGADAARESGAPSGDGGTAVERANAAASGTGDTQPPAQVAPAEGQLVRPDAEDSQPHVGEGGCGAAIAGQEQPVHAGADRPEVPPRTEDTGEFTPRPAPDGETRPADATVAPARVTGQEAAERWLGVQENRQYLDEIYEYLHRHPELSDEEEGTIRKVREVLERAGMVVTEVPGGGLVCDLGKPGPDGWILLTADMDALQIQEETGAEFASENPGVMHACGHDVHTTVLLGAALAMNEAAREAGAEMPGVRFVWRRAEENSHGANALKAAGVFDNVEIAAAAHVDPTLEVGKVGIRGGFDENGNAKDGVINWSSRTFRILFKGPGGHTGHPEDTIKLPRVMSDFVGALEDAFTFSRFRRKPVPGEQLRSEGVVGVMKTGEEPNVIPKEGSISGTIRNRDNKTRLAVPKRLMKLIDKFRRKTGAQIEIADLDEGVPPVVNDPVAADRMARAVTATLGPDAVVVSPESKGGDDFGVISNEVPGIYFQLGVKPVGAEPGKLHDSLMLPDRGALAHGVKAFAAFAWEGEEQLPARGKAGRPLSGPDTEGSDNSRPELEGERELMPA